MQNCQAMNSYLDTMTPTWYHRQRGLGTDVRQRETVRLVVPSLPDLTGSRRRVPCLGKTFSVEQHAPFSQAVRLPRGDGTGSLSVSPDGSDREAKAVSFGYRVA